MDGKFLLENPGSTLIFMYYLFLRAVRLLKAVGHKVGLLKASLQKDSWSKFNPEYQVDYPSCNYTGCKFENPLVMCGPLNFSCVTWFLYCPTPPGQVYQVSMWMQDFKHPTPKRSLLVSNTSGIADFLPGKRMKKRSRKAKFPTSVQYKNKQGKSCWKGSPQLKSTQTLDMTLVDLFDSCIISFCSSRWLIAGMNHLYEPSLIFISKSEIFKLRTYTPRFARALLEMIPAMTSEPHIWNRPVP